ncbi:uncharacterized protein METZ01_LOCUS141696 [marine metagenome]|uniref:Uncharacterized protein n=1 Tax=marine metagenome TaxID=408172 RepID=A0A381ZJ26_9ZZZZ
MQHRLAASAGTVSIAGTAFFWAGE